ncbi:Ribonuclease T1 (fragment) [Burkholderiales bacterium 8X]
MLFNEADAREQWRRPFQPVEDAVTFAELPAEARQTYQAILSGGPFQFDKDGSVFANRERLLPAERRGHYREYTVAAANSGRRGARRIVCGGVPRVPETCWYTADHYASFKRIKQ